MSSLRGFARMDKTKQLELARKGGHNVPKEKRSFSTNHTLASEAGKKGGRMVAPSKRLFATNPERAREAGKKGAQERVRRLRIAQARKALNV